MTSKRNWTAFDLNTEWTFGTDSPKNDAIDKGTQQKHQVFLEQVTSKGRRFGSYPTLKDMSEAIGTANHHLFEILTDTTPLKVYLDVEWSSTEAEGLCNLQEIIDKLGTACKDILNIQLQPSHIRTSCASGEGDQGGYVGKYKHSFHIVLDNGYAFSSVQQVRAFVALAFAGDDRVDLVPYQKNQSFKLIHQSKLNSNRVQRPTDGASFMQHMVTSFSSPPRLYCTDKLSHAEDRKTRLQVVSPEPVRQPSRLYIADDVDIHSVACLLKYFPNGPDHASKQPFAVFLAVACICVNEGEPYVTFTDWASKYSSWSAVKCDRIWKSLTKRLDGYDIRTLRTLLDKANPSVLKDMQAKQIDSVMFPTIDFSANCIDYFEYSNPMAEPWLDQANTYKHLMIRSPMGSGKTFQIVNHIAHMRPASVLVITPRQLFARSMLGTLKTVLPDLKCYKDLPYSERDCPYIVCQLESLWTLIRTYELVIVDESESILYQFSSPTIREFQPICDVFKTVITSAKTVIYSDAFLADRTLLTCVNIDPSASRCFIYNKWMPTGRRAFCAGLYGEGKKSIVQAAQHLSSERNVVVSASKELAKVIKNVLEPSGTVSLITSETSDDIKKQLEDVNTFLAPAKHFVYTSSLTVGTSFDTRDHFDNLLMYTSACSNNVRDSIQASMRVRHIQKERMIYAAYPRYHGTNRFDVGSRARLRAMLEGREKAADELEENRKGDADHMWMMRERLEEWQKVIWIANKQEDNLSAFCHLKMLRAYLELCGYELMDSDMSFGEEVTAQIEAMDFFEIPSPTAEEHVTLRKMIERGQASAEMKAQFIKGNFIWQVVPNSEALKAELVARMFKVYARDQMGIEKKIKNHRAEKKKHVSALNIFSDNTAQKAQVVGDLCSQLGIKDACDIGAQIERSIMEKSCSQAVEMKAHLAEVFDLKLREANGKRGTMKRGLELLNSCLSRFGFTQIVADGPRKRKRTGGKQVNICDYVLAANTAYPGFAEHAV